MGFPQIGERLFCGSLMKELSKPIRGILGPSITVKNETGIWITLLPCGLKCRGDQLGAIFPGHLICGNLAGKQVQNRTSVSVALFQPEASDIICGTMRWMRYGMGNIISRMPLPRGKSSPYQPHSSVNRPFSSRKEAL